MRRFLSRDIDSIGTLEVLVLVCCKRDRAWSVDDLVRETRTTEFAIRQRLSVLRKLNLVDERDGWQYVASPADDEVVVQTVDAFREMRLRVIEAIYSNARGSFREFAEAFRLRDDEEPE